MGGEDSAHIAQGGGSRGSSHEEPRIAGGLRGSECGYLHMYRRALRELVAKTDFVTCDIQSSRTTYEWNPDVRPSLYDLVIRLEGGVHEVSNSFWVVREHLHDAAFAPGEPTLRRADARISLEHLRRRTRLPGAVRTEQGQIAPYEFTNDRTCGTHT